MSFVSHHHIGIAVRDVAKTTQLLVGLLEAELLPAPGTGHTLLGVGGLRIALSPFREGEHVAHAWGEHLAFSVPSTARNQLVQRLNDLGCTHEDVRGRLYARDAEGLTFEFMFE